MIACSRSFFILDNYSKLFRVHGRSWNTLFMTREVSTSFPGPLVFPSSLAPGEGKTRGPGNEVGEVLGWNIIK